MGFSRGLKENVDISYTTNVHNEFYNPVLEEAETYKRVVGYLSLDGMELFVEGLDTLINNGGSLELIVSKKISKEDYEKIERGYDLFTELAKESLIIDKELLDEKVKEELGILAFMIAIGRAKVKIGFTYTGIFHDKFGLFEVGGESIMFAGSANETVGGLKSNYESIVVDVSWDSSQRVKKRIKEYSNRFDRLSRNEEDNVIVIEASELVYEQFSLYQNKYNLNDYLPKDGAEENILDYEDAVTFELLNDVVVRYDYSKQKITENDRKLRVNSDLGYFFENDNSTIKPDTSYVDIERIIQVTKARCNRLSIKVIVSKLVENYINIRKYSISQYKIMGNVLQEDPTNFPSNRLSSYLSFCRTVQNEVSRPLLEVHLRAAFYKYEMVKAANFSVPGSGKTAMILGVFAYLNSLKCDNSEKIERIVVVAPISAFQSWKDEFKLVFGNKKDLIAIDCQSSDDFKLELRMKLYRSNLVLVNYESLPKFEEELTDLIGIDSMLVFDEVHRIKNPEGIRASASLNIAKKSKFKYVLTGTPIPNSYRDIYNFLNILYSAEYNSFFGWNTNELVAPRYRVIKDINFRIKPFFWRTNKLDLSVPEVDKDIIINVSPSSKQLAVASEIYRKEKSSLSMLIRLIQLSTNPSLLNKAISYEEIMCYDEGNELNVLSEEEFTSLLKPNEPIKIYDEGGSSYANLNLPQIESPKFNKGIELVKQLVLEGKKVLVWGIYVDTLEKIQSQLNNMGIRANLVYGATEKSARQELIEEFKFGNIDVLVTNPQTLGESISLHKNVHDAVYFEYDFNLTFMLQSRDRIHRLGLPEGQYTRYYYLQTKSEPEDSKIAGFIDEQIYSRLKEKEEVMYNAIDNKMLNITYSSEEIDEAIKIIDKERLRIKQ